MRLRSTTDVGALVRDARLRQGLTQVELARQAGVSGRWLASLEEGRDRVDLGLVLRVLEVLEIALEATSEVPAASPRLDLDAIIRAHLPVEPWQHPQQ